MNKIQAEFVYSHLESFQNPQGDTFHALQVEPSVWFILPASLAVAPL